MTSFVKKIVGTDDRSVLILAYLLLTVAFLGLGSSALVFFSTGISEGFFNKDLCITNECVLNFSKGFSAVFSILQVTGAILAGLITLGGILIALLAYVSSLNTTALSNHIAHLGIFHTYVTAEIEKRSRLSRGCFDLLCWYNLIYTSSKQGQLAISENYHKFIAELNFNISRSNSLALNKENGGYRYKTHQEEMKKTLLHAGIVMHSLPRLDFDEAEGEVLDLIDNINKSFCNSSSTLKITKRVYL